MEAGIYQRLSTDIGVSALCGSRIFPLLLPEATTYPALTYQRISTVADYANDGHTGFTQARLQIDVWGNSYGDVKTLEEAVRHSLEDFTGTLSDGTYVANIMRDDSTDLYESAARLYRVQTDWLILFNQ